MSERIPQSNISLADLDVGERAVVIGFRERTAYANNLLRLGLIPGTTFEVLRRAPLGDPLEIHFRGFALALRPSEAGDMIVERA